MQQRHNSHRVRMIFRLRRLPRHTKLERAGVLNRESSRSVFLCSLNTERTISTSLRLNNC